MVRSPSGVGVGQTARRRVVQNQRVTSESGGRRVDGARVWVATPSLGDIPAYEIAVIQSRGSLAAFSPAEPYDLPAAIAAESATHRSFLVHAREPGSGHGLVGRINIRNVIYGRALTANVGYSAYDPYAGRGLLREGLMLVLAHSFDHASTGLGLHRVEAVVQPRNTRSIRLLYSLGFRHEGYSPELLWLPGEDGHEGWQGHDRFAILADEWAQVAR